MSSTASSIMSSNSPAISSTASPTFTASDLFSIMTDLHFEREALDGSDPSTAADVIRHQMLQISMTRSILGEENVGDLEFERLRLAADYSDLVDNNDGSASSSSNLNNFAGLVTDDSSASTKVRKWKSSALDALNGNFQDKKTKQRWSFFDGFVENCRKSTVKLDLELGGRGGADVAGTPITTSKLKDAFASNPSSKENESVYRRSALESPFRAPSLLGEDQDPLRSREDVHSSVLSSKSAPPANQRTPLFDETASADSTFKRAASGDRGHPAKRRREDDATAPNAYSPNNSFSSSSKPWSSSEAFANGNRVGSSNSSNYTNTSSNNFNFKNGSTKATNDDIASLAASVRVESSSTSRSFEFKHNGGDRSKPKQNRWNKNKKSQDVDDDNDSDGYDGNRGRNNLNNNNRFGSKSNGNNPDNSNGQGKDSEFRTAHQQLLLNNAKQNKRGDSFGGNNNNSNSNSNNNNGLSSMYGSSKKTLGGKGGGVYSRFKPPVRNEDEGDFDNRGGRGFNDGTGRRDGGGGGAAGRGRDYDDGNSPGWNNRGNRSGSNTPGDDPLHQIASRVLGGGRENGGGGGGEWNGGGRNNGGRNNCDDSASKKNDGPRSDLIGPDGEPVHELLRNLDPKLIESIENEIVDRGKPVEWEDIAGLVFAKKTLNEVVVWPMLRPDIFTGLRAPPKGLLLFGPPGTGKTMIGKCIACKSKSTFFSISASSLTSKWIGEGEKLVRTLFAVARVRQPSVIFIDEIDSLLSQRTESEHEASRRMKTQFLIELDGATSAAGEEKLLIIGATNRPQELDEAARRRLVKRLLIPLPDEAARRCIVENLLQSQRHDLSDSDLETVAKRAHHYSGSDMAHLCRDASMGPIRELSDIMNIESADVRPISLKDFIESLSQVRASVSEKELVGYREWDKLYGSFDSSK